MVKWSLVLNLLGMLMTISDEKWMQQALVLADRAEALGEVPVGAIVVRDDEIIGQGHNCPITRHDPTAHAEIMAIREAANYLENYRLVNCSLYVTIAPCTMCVGAIIHSRIQRIVFGAREPKAGAVVSSAQLLNAPYMNHQVSYLGGVCEELCSEKISQFFANRRKQNK